MLLSTDLSESVGISQLREYFVADVDAWRGVDYFRGRRSVEHGLVAAFLGHAFNGIVHIVLDGAQQCLLFLVQFTFGAEIAHPQLCGFFFLVGDFLLAGFCLVVGEEKNLLP